MKVTENIYYGLLGENYAIFYAEEKPRGYVAFYKDILNKNSGPLLEIAGGSGRVTLPLRREGIDIAFESKKGVSP